MIAQTNRIIGLNDFTNYHEWFDINACGVKTSQLRSLHSVLVE